MIMCCGKVRTGKFCSECGKLIEVDNPLLQILWHIRASVRKEKSAYERRKSYRPNEPEPKTLVKWRRWEEAMEEVIQNNREGGTQ